jgi:hypothetical protein
VLPSTYSHLTLNMASSDIYNDLTEHARSDMLGNASHSVMDAGFVIFGGYVRDTLRGDRPNDIDVMGVPSRHAKKFLKSFKKLLVHRDEYSDAYYTHSRHSYTMGIPGVDAKFDYEIDIDFVKNPECGGAGVDFDVNTLGMKYVKGEMVIFSLVTLKKHPLCSVLSNVYAKKFEIVSPILQLSPRTAIDSVKYLKLIRRYMKMIGRGWVCETPLPPHFKDMMSTDNTGECVVCMDDMKTFFKMNCCKNSICTSCTMKIIETVKTDECPFCRQHFYAW